MSIHLIRRNILLILLSFGCCFGQGSHNIISVFNGEIRGEARGAATVELVDSKTQSLAGRSMVDSNGTFVLRDVAPGSYLVRLIPMGGANTLRPEELTVSVGQPQESENRGPGGTVSVGTLANPPSKKALKLLDKAQHFSEAGDSKKAIEVLKSATLDPAGAPYIHSRLGTEYLKSGQFELAVPELLEASRLAPKESANYSNLAYAYQALGELNPAEAQARRALELDHANPKAHFLLGAILLEGPSTMEEAMDNLKVARKDVPSARFLLAQAYMLKGQRDAANREMSGFLDVANDSQRAAAKSWLDHHRGPRP